jgi:hypothetical protein
LTIIQHRETDWQNSSVIMVTRRIGPSVSQEPRLYPLSVPYDVVVTDLIVKCISPRELLEGIEQLPGHPALVVLAPVPPNHPSLADIPPHARVLFEPTDPDEIVSAVESLAPAMSTGAR